MKIAIGADHGGWRAKEFLVRRLVKQGHEVLDSGAFGEASSDYPDYAEQVARAVAKRRASRGILVCGTGIGMSIAANKIQGIRAAVVWNEKTAALAAEHNGANVLCLGGRLFPPATLARLANTWLTTPFGGGRHARRLRKIAHIDKMGNRA